MSLASFKPIANQLEVEINVLLPIGVLILILGAVGGCIFHLGPVLSIDGITLSAMPSACLSAQTQAVHASAII